MGTTAHTKNPPIQRVRKFREGEAKGVDARPCSQRRYLGEGGPLGEQHDEEHPGRLEPAVGADPAPADPDRGAGVDHQRGDNPSEERGDVGEHHGSGNPRLGRVEAAGMER